MSQTHRSQDCRPKLTSTRENRNRFHVLTLDIPKWKYKHHYPEQCLNNLRYEILHVYSCFHNTQARWLHGFCLQLSHFFAQSMKLLAHCFIFVLPFKLNDKRTCIHFRINMVLLKLFRVAAICKNKAESSQRTLNLDGFPPESFDQIQYIVPKHTSLAMFLINYHTHQYNSGLLSKAFNPQGLKLRGDQKIHLLSNMGVFL